MEVTSRRIRTADYGWPGARSLAAEVIRYAETVGRKDVSRDLRFALFRSGALRSLITRLVAVSCAAERRAKPCAALLRLPKHVLKRLGWGRGWFY